MYSPTKRTGCDMPSAQVAAGGGCAFAARPAITARAYGEQGNPRITAQWLSCVVSVSDHIHHPRSWFAAREPERWLNTSSNRRGPGKFFRADETSRGRSSPLQVTCKETSRCIEFPLASHARCKQAGARAAGNQAPGTGGSAAPLPLCKPSDASLQPTFLSMETLPCILNIVNCLELKQCTASCGCRAVMGAL